MTEPPSASDAAHPDRRHQEPESLRLRSVAPSFTVDDLQASLAFYVDGLGFTVEERWEEEGELRGVMLLAGSCRLGISQDDFAKGRDRQKGVGFRIWAESAQDLDALAGRAREHGLDPDGPKTEPWGSRTLTVTDPDGFTMTFTPPRGE